MESSANSTTEHCCICLEQNDIVSCCFRDKIRHIPCSCNMYCHKYCFEKTDTKYCMICKQKYKLSWGENPENPKKPNCFKKFKKKIKKKYIFGKISLQKQNRRLENSVRNFMNMLYYPDFGNCCLDMSAATLYSIIVLFFTIFCVFIGLSIGGYYLNILICSVFNLWENKHFCLLEPSDGLLYLLGIIGVPILIANTACCYMCCGPLLAQDRTANRRVFPYGLV